MCQPDGIDQFVLPEITSLNLDEGVSQYPVLTFLSKLTNLSRSHCK
jgi:hypothetical protein